MQSKKNVIVIGAGPVGLAAAAHLMQQGQTPIVLERGDNVGHAMAQWAHVRVFTPWKYLIDTAVETLLKATDWQMPDAEGIPLAGEIVDQYLVPAATKTALATHIRYGANVIAITKTGHSKLSSHQRETADYTVQYRSTDGDVHRLRGDAVIDASGTWFKPNPIGLDGLPVPGEIENAAHITYGIPDVLGKHRHRYQGQHTLVVGGGHSAINVVLDLLKLEGSDSPSHIYWGLRGANLQKLLGGGEQDALPARGALGLAAKDAIESGRLTLLTSMQVNSVSTSAERLVVNLQTREGDGPLAVDQIIVATGFRPDLSITGELRLSLDSTVEAPAALAPLIDPNLHSCGTVMPHGADVLSHLDGDFYVVGMKSYGRAPTFLMMTGYEQVRSIAAALAGDAEAANRLQLTLPETGVCNADYGDAAVACCAEPEQQTSCCG
ncbi:Ferredoxin--NADP reductase [BD1-7 clade bacterium]|uniref:Ferredoxin--NADP reductase n=1 Tax=BD1-7 clade bacterium TaxID=2029982 RepID=A0A5S9PEC6_9GAMM|nr:Ferredoxin--NADP reductase [BD1-7 clade bacterium]